MEIWAEAGACEGDLDYAFACVDAVAEAGADALKVQWLRPETIFHPDAVRYDSTPGDWSLQTDGYPKVLSYLAWKDVLARCTQRGIEFIPAVFDLDAVEQAAEMGVQQVKIASGDITNEALIKYAAGTVPWLTLSTGGATMDEVERAVVWAYEQNTGIMLTLLACHLQYPTPLEDANLGRILALQEKWPQVRIGYSDHTPGLDTVPMVTTLGAQVLEKHFTLKKAIDENDEYVTEDWGTLTGDHSFGLGPDDLAMAVKLSQYSLAIIGNVEMVPTPGEQAAIIGARRSLYAFTDIAKGERLTPQNVIALRPHDPVGYGAEDWTEIVANGVKKGLPAVIDIPKGTLITSQIIGFVSASLSVT